MLQSITDLGPGMRPDPRAYIAEADRLSDGKAEFQELLERELETARQVEAEVLAEVERLKAEAAAADDRYREAVEPALRSAKRQAKKLRKQGKRLSARKLETLQVQLLNIRRPQTMTESSTLYFEYDTEATAEAKRLAHEACQADQAVLAAMARHADVRRYVTALEQQLAELREPPKREPLPFEKARQAVEALELSGYDRELERQVERCAQLKALAQEALDGAMKKLDEAAELMEAHDQAVLDAALVYHQREFERTRVMAGEMHQRWYEIPGPVWPEPRGKPDGAAIDAVRREHPDACGHVVVQRRLQENAYIRRILRSLAL